MKSILIAPDKFKGSLTAREFCLAVEGSLKVKWPRLELFPLPLSDGGEGFLEVISKTGDFTHFGAVANDPLGRPIKSYYLKDTPNNKVFIETARVSGLQLLQKGELNCLASNTFGLGQLICHINLKDIHEIFIGIGGTATCDAGTGMALALGYRFLDRYDRELVPLGKHLRDISRIISPPKLDQKIKVTGLCDVNNPMHGINGAAFTYARQKGADDIGIQLLDEGLANVAFLMERDLGVSVQDLPGSGAGGALGAGLVAFLGAELLPGAEFILKHTCFHQHLEKVDLVITGEGRLDDQSKNGKLCYVVAQESKKSGKPVIAIVGNNQLNDLACFDEILSLEESSCEGMDPFEDAAFLVSQLAIRAVENRMKN